MSLVCEMLGFARVSTTQVVSLGPWRSATVHQPNSPEVHDEVGDAARPTHTEEQSKIDTADMQLLPTSLRRLEAGSGTKAPPAWLTESTPALGTEESLVPPPSTFPLYIRRTRRAILSAALGTDFHEGHIDLRSLIDQLSRGKIIRQIPRLPILSLRRGVQILFDHGRGMEPFASDRDDLLVALLELFPAERVRVLNFADAPSRGCGPGDREKWGQWTAPAAGTPVLVVSNMGIGGPLVNPERSSTSEWQSFGLRVSVAGCAALALVPYPAERWPRELLSTMCLLHWSEKTTARQVAMARQRK